MSEPAFWDASALVPLCVTEHASSAARKCLDQYSPVVWWGTIAEIHSAIWRAARARKIDTVGARQAMISVRWLQSLWLEIRPDEAVRDTACELLERYPLRAADSLQLAAAMTWCRGRPSARRFLCADRRLSEAAEAAGFSVLSN